MIVKGTPYVLEFNARMGDPETEVVLPLLKTDLVDVMEAVVDHRLDQLAVEWRNDTAVCVVMSFSWLSRFVSGGLPHSGPDDPACGCMHRDLSRWNKERREASGDCRWEGARRDGLGSVTPPGKRAGLSGRTLNSVRWPTLSYRHRASGIVTQDLIEPASASWP